MSAISHRQWSTEILVRIYNRVPLVNSITNNEWIFLSFFLFKALSTQLMVDPKCCTIQKSKTIEINTERKKKQQKNPHKTQNNTNTCLKAIDNICFYT